MWTAPRAESRPPPPIPPFLLAQNLSSKRIVPTDNMRPKSDDTITTPNGIIGGYTFSSQLSWYLREIQVEHREAMGAEIGSSAICRFLHKVGFSRQVIKLVALQRDKEICVRCFNF